MAEEKVPVNKENISGYDVHILFNGYSNINADCSEMTANCTCTLIKGPLNIIVDTMTAWDGENIIEGLMKHGVTPEDVDYVICTHGHSDHTGNNNLFLNAKHIVGFSISFKNTYYVHPFDEGKAYQIDSEIQVIPTPGHTLSDVTVIVRTRDQEIYAIAGDLFECFEDIDEPSQWIQAGSEAPKLQRKHRQMIADLANWIVPGHGPIFPANEEVRRKLATQYDEQIE